MNNFNLIGKQKELRYVTVYNKLFKMITEGFFPEDSRLPSEPELAKSLGISRTTLRQALALLQDDGLIKNIRGKGNFIVKSIPNRNVGLEKMTHPVHKCMNNDIDDIEIKTHIEPSNEYFNKLLQTKTVAVVVVDRWYKSQGNTIAYSFSVLPIETISKYNLDLNDSNIILEFLETLIYNISSNIMLEIKFSAAGNFATKSHPILSEHEFFLLQETVFENDSFPIVSTKHYLPLKLSSLRINIAR